MNQIIASLPVRARRDAIRTLRGQALRVELYALDGTENASRPYVVSESLSGLREIPIPPSNDPKQPRVFFPHLLPNEQHSGNVETIRRPALHSQRTTTTLDNRGNKHP